MSALSGQRLLVTGATGFIGARLCVRAVEQGADVHAVSRNAGAWADGLTFERADLTDQAAVDGLVQRVRPDLVLHLAGEVSGAREREHALPMLHANLVASVNLMTACLDAGSRRLVLAGSMEEPDLGDPEAVAQSPYAAAKWAALAYARMFHALYGLPVVHLRVFMVYGPGQHDLGKLVPYVTSSLLKGSVPSLTGGDRPIDWVYVDDVVDAFLRAAAATGVDGRSFDIGSGELATVREVALSLSELVGGDVEPAFGAIPDRGLERVRVADPRAAAEAIGWRASTRLELGLAKTVEFYRDELDRPAPA